MLAADYLLDILKLTIAGIGVVWVALYLVKPYLERSERMQVLEIKKAISSQTIPLKLQAYERLALFTERINPENLLIRLNAGSYSGRELHSLIINEIRNEYQHNLTQQIYVSTDAWHAVKKLKDNTLLLIGNLVTATNADTSGIELSKSVLAHIAQLDENPYEATVAILKKDLESIF